MKNELISSKGYEKLYTEYLSIEKQIQSTLVKMGESAKIDNDLRENPEFMELRVKAMYTLPKLKEELYERYMNSTIIEETEEYRNFNGSKVIIGSEVTIDFGDEEVTYKILGSKEGNLSFNIISCESSLAKALMGRKVGETFSFNDSNISILSIKKIT